jgi:hypothetical protein
VDETAIAVAHTIDRVRTRHMLNLATRIAAFIHTSLFNAAHATAIWCAYQDRRSRLDCRIMLPASMTHEDAHTTAGRIRVPRAVPLRDPHGDRTHTAREARRIGDAARAEEG